MVLWSGRFSAPSDDDLKKLNDSLSFDRRMYRQDIAGSRAYADAICASGVLTPAERDAIVSGLDQVQSEMDAGTFAFQPSDEDIHTAVERRLTEIIGDIGGKLHTGRSRNDQVATDLRLWTAEALAQLAAAVHALQHAIVATSEGHIDTLMPGYTHVQPAQPVTAAHWLMSYFWMFARDQERLTQITGRVRWSPLGAGALAGNPFGIDRHALARALNLGTPMTNSIDAVSDRDYVAETLFAVSLLATHLSRLSEDLIWFSNPALGFITLDDRYSTGSSMMPQKRNPDPMELARGKAGRLIGNLTGFLATLKGLPTGYNKDLQEDKEALFDSLDNMLQILPVISAVVRTLKINPARMAEALDEEMLATDLADYLVRKGMPFRQAHHCAGTAVRVAGEKGVRLSALAVGDYQAITPLFGDDVHQVLSFSRSIANRSAFGGTAPSAVQEQIALARAVLAQSE
ncbi:MAG: argininosuccinate lyase [Pleurocapsa minor GSE-CHR-MK-17-07R]|jgi:argininosuccinate lyase|nr:argininosuccinate lyase [Pleurocapsa minor GSE-CHR-MK 17-07R]